MTFVLHSASSREMAPLLSIITTCHRFFRSNAEMSNKGLAFRKLFPKAKKVRRTLVVLGRGGRRLGRECLPAVFICGPLNPVRIGAQYLISAIGWGLWNAPISA